MTKEELAKHDGKDGRPAYIAVNGKVYDVSESPRWENGLHPPDHMAGQDLTEELAQAPHVRAVVDRFPFIDTLEVSPSESSSGGLGKVVIGVVVVVLIIAFFSAILL